MRLNREMIKDLQVHAEHFAECADSDSQFELANKYLDLARLIKDLPNRFTIEVKRVELIPDTTDPIINACIKHLLDLLENDDTYDCDESIALQNKLWDYLDQNYGFDHEKYDLLKATVEEGFSFAFNHIGIVR